MTNAGAARGRVFYGWWIVAVCFLLTALASGTAFYAFGLFIVPFDQEFGWGRGAISGAISLHFFLTALAAPIVGRLVDRYGPRYLMIGGVALAGTSYLLLSRVSSLPALYALWALLAVGVASFNMVPVSSLVSRWFVRRRGLAMGAAMMGVGAGGFVLAPIIGTLIPPEALGWRGTSVVLGLVLLTVPVPFIFLVLKNAPAQIGLLPDGDGPVVAVNGTAASTKAIAQPSGWTLDRAVRTPAFWLVSGTFFLGSTATVGVLQHEASFLRDYNVPATLAAFAVGATSGVGTTGKLFFGYLSDKVAVRYAALVSFSSQIAGLALLLLTQEPWALVLFVFLFGLGMGATVVLVPLLVAEVFGTARFGVLLGAINMVQGVGLAVGPYAAGRIYDASGSYALAFQVSLALYVGATVLVFLARRPKEAAPTPAAALTVSEAGARRQA
jgi:MFS family permease